MSVEFLIKRVDGAPWDLDAEFPDWLRPASRLSVVVSANPYTIAVDDVEIVVSDEGDFGFQVCFPDVVSREWAAAVVDEILASVSKRTGQPGRIVEIS